MFNPLRLGTAPATPTDGLIPTGIHLGNFPAPQNYYPVSRPLYLVGGGVKENQWVTHVKQFANKNNLTYGDALKNLKCKASYRIGGANSPYTPSYKAIDKR